MITSAMPAVWLLGQHSEMLQGIADHSISGMTLCANIQSAVCVKSCWIIQLTSLVVMQLIYIMQTMAC